MHNTLHNAYYILVRGDRVIDSLYAGRKTVVWAGIIHATGRIRMPFGLITRQPRNAGRETWGSWRTRP